MKKVIPLLLLAAAQFQARAADHYVSPLGAHVPPFIDWAGAATNIQSAIDAAGEGETVWVTNGVYATGGRFIAGDLTNRVALTKALAVRSVNGPAETVIKGQWDPATNGPLAIRCAWLTNGATLDGFTLTGGATRQVTATPDPQQQSGGGVYAASTNALVINCLITNNAASYQGGGAYNVTLQFCRVLGNRVIPTGAVINAGQGGAAAACEVQNCTLQGNYATSYGGALSACNASYCSIANNSCDNSGGGADASRLIHCTVVGNSVPSASTKMGGGAARSVLTNCIVYANSGYSSYSNYYSSTLAFCCSAPLPAGPGNTNANPLLLADKVHIFTNSPCIGAGVTLTAIGTDIDGQAWANPPSIGCDEWLPEPVLYGNLVATCRGGNGELTIGGIDCAGQPPFTYLWYKNSTGPLEDGDKFGSAHTTNLLVRHFDPADAGSYQVIASNLFGTATSAVARVLIHCVDPAGASPAPPYSSWATAANNYRDAIDSALAGDFVLVTNGLYATGGRVMAGDLTNRVVVDKPITVVSANGPGVTTISGTWDPVSTNGPGAVRCVWLGEGATLSGFTIQNGATRSSGDLATLKCGGGTWSEDLTGVGAFRTATIANCVFSNNAAALGGGAYHGIFYRSRFVNNVAESGGGVYTPIFLYNCLLQGNCAKTDGGGAYSGNLRNCTLVNNSAGRYGGGAYLSAFTPPAINCIVYFNTAPAYSNLYTGGGFYAPPQYCCTSPLLTGAGNIGSDPQLTDGQHLALGSPCRAAGSASGASGTDLDGEPWGTAPSIGCDEVWEASIGGSLAVSLNPASTEVVQGRSIVFTGSVSGRASRIAWDFGDGTSAINVSFITSHAWTQPGKYNVTLSAYNADNLDGVSASAMVTILALQAPYLANATLVTNTFTFTFDGQNGVTYVFERATNLSPPVVWQTISTLPSTGGVMKATDNQPTNAISFYRIRAQ